MKIKSLYIQKYQLLEDLQIPFGEIDILSSGDYSLTVLAGLNGSGKTTILRALGEIFATIKADQPCDFDYKFTYELSTGSEVSVDFCRARPNPYEIKVDGATQNGFDEVYKPNELVVHTTGLEHLWDEIVSHDESQTVSVEILQDQLISRVQEKPVGTKIKTSPGLQKPPFFLFRNQIASLVTLCGLLRWKQEGTEESLLGEVLDQLQIKRLVGFSLNFQLHPSLSNYDEFNRLVPLCDEHIQQGAMHKLVFDAVKNRQLLEEFSKGKTGYFEAFQDLEKLLYPENGTPPVLHCVETFFEVEQEVEVDNDDEEGLSHNKKKIIPFNWLSDGEQNFLSRMAMLTLLDVSNSIILMDEPEVHFNDYWKRKIITMIDQVLKESHNHLIMTTHSSVVLSDAFPGQVMLTRKNDEGNCEIISNLPPVFGAESSEIMVDLLGADNAVGAFSSAYIEDALTRGDKKQLTQLLELVGPGFMRFLIRDRLRNLDA